MRVSDADRRAAGERLRLALSEGRLDFAEYDDRIARAYRAVTYGDLDDLFTDLPAPVPARPAAAALPVHPAARPGAVPAARRGLPTALRVLWTIWASVVAVNLVVWLLVSIGNGVPDTFWPMWLLVPGAVLAAVTASVMAARRPGPGQRRED
jgi:Domain of unknown function (DUF1707)